MIEPLLTTSWDDGHVLDFKVADLLSKYDLTGTFYIPRNAPTTLQAATHTPWTFAKNIAKRRAVRNLWMYILRAHSASWHENVRKLLAATLTRGGVFHLWGHSWEIQEQQQWDRLEYVLKLMSEIRAQAPCLTNAQVCSRTRIAMQQQPGGATLLGARPFF